MEERRDQPQERESGPPGLIASSGQLSPVQQAQQRRHTHANSCRQCADIDRPLCAEGERLLRAWNEAMDDAYRQLHRGAR